MQEAKTRTTTASRIADKMNDAEADELIGRNEKWKRKAEAEARRKEKEEKQRAAQVKAQQAKEDTSIEFVTQYHVCSFCGGFKKRVLKSANLPLVVITKELPQPSPDGKAEPLVICSNCERKVYSTILGQAQYYGIEMDHLTDEQRSAFSRRTRRMG